MRAKQEVMIKERETQLAQKEKEARLSKAELKKQRGKDKAQVVCSCHLSGRQFPGLNRACVCWSVGKCNET